MLRLAHLSDIHLAPLPVSSPFLFLGKRLLGYLNWFQRKYIHQRAVLDALTADLHAQAPDHIAVTGDLVNLALPREFEAARDWLAELGPPERVSVVPGNHDAYVRLWRSPGIGLWRDYMTSNPQGAQFLAAAYGAREARTADDQMGRGAFPYLRIFGRVALIGVSTAQPTLPTVAAGRLGAAQRGRLAALLGALGAQHFMRVLLIHHQPLPGVTSWRRALHDAAELQALLQEHGVELVLHGHEHNNTLRWLAWRGGRIPIVGVPSASAAPPGTKAPPARKPPARYNLFHLEAGESPSGWRIEMIGRGLDGRHGRPGECDRRVLLPLSMAKNSAA